MNPVFLSLENVLSLIKNPPLIKIFLESKQVLDSKGRDNIILFKNHYENSLNSLISSKESEVFFRFGYLLNRYRFLFGEELSNVLNSLKKSQIEYILGELRFEKNLKSYKDSLPSTFSGFSH